MKEPPDWTGKEPTLDIPIGGSEQDKTIRNDKCMLCVINKLDHEDMFITLV